MEHNIFEGDPNYAEALKLAQAAKAERDRAQVILDGAKKIEDQAVIKFQEIRTGKVQELKRQKEELEERYSEMEKEYREMFRKFCQVRGKHQNTFRSVITSYREIAHSFSRGSIYPTETYYTCQICGASNDPSRFRHYYDGPSEEGWEVIKESAKGKEDEKPEVKELAEKILAYPAQMEEVENLLKKNAEAFEEICRLFGHDAEVVNYDCETYKCRCCGKTLSYQKYINAHYHATFRGGIVGFNYEDESPIL